MATRNKTSISKEQVSDRAVQRSHITADIGLIRTHKSGTLFYAGELIAKTFTDVNNNEYIKTFTVKADFTGSSNFTNDLTNYLVDNSTIQNKVDKVGAGYTGKVASFDANGNLQSSGYDQSGLHTHSNLSVLAAISNAGSGQIITTAERNKLNGIEASAKNNTVQNIGASGVGVYKNQIGSQFNLKKIDGYDNKIQVIDDVGNDRIQVRLIEANVALNANQIAVVDTNGYLNATDAQTAFDNLSVQTRSNSYRVGNDAAGDKYFRFARSSGPDDPGFRWLESGTKLQWSNDGTTWNDVSSGAGTLASAAAYKTVNQTAVAPIIEFDSVVYDTASAVSLSPWKFTAPVTGDYDIEGRIISDASSYQIVLFKNGTTTGIVLGLSFASSGFKANIFSGSISLNAGDYIDVRSDYGLSATYYNLGYIKVKKAH